MLTLGNAAFPVSTRGSVALVTWAERLGRVVKVGIEGTGTYGAGLARFARDDGLDVVEVDRPDRSTRRRRGKSDPIDAEAAARVTLAGTARTTPKSRQGRVEMIRVLRVARRGALKARVLAGRAAARAGDLGARGAGRPAAAADHHPAVGRRLRRVAPPARCAIRSRPPSTRCA